MSEEPPATNEREAAARQGRELFPWLRPPPAPPLVPGPTPLLTEEFKSSSGRTVLQYYTFASNATGQPFRGVIHTRPNFEQVEVFLTGLEFRSASQVDKLTRIAATVQKYRYDPSTGELEIGVRGQFTTTGQNSSYVVSFIVVLTDGTVARFSPTNTGCRDIAICDIPRYLPTAVPPSMHFIGLATQSLDVGSDSGPVSVYQLGGHADGLSLMLPAVSFRFYGSLTDAAVSNQMFMEWAGSAVAFDTSEMARPFLTPPPFFPWRTFLGNGSAIRRVLYDQVSHPTGAPIRGMFDALEGVAWLYHPQQDHDVWMVEASATPPTVSSAGVATASYGMFLGTTFGDKAATIPFAYQLSRAVGLLL